MHPDASHLDRAFTLMGGLIFSGAFCEMLLQTDDGRAWLRQHYTPETVELRVNAAGRFAQLRAEGRALAAIFEAMFEEGYLDGLTDAPVGTVVRRN